MRGAQRSRARGFVPTHRSRVLSSSVARAFAGEAARYRGPSRSTKPPTHEPQTATRRGRGANTNCASHERSRSRCSCIASETPSTKRQATDARTANGDAPGTRGKHKFRKSRALSVSIARVSRARRPARTTIRRRTNRKRRRAGDEGQTPIAQVPTALVLVCSCRVFRARWQGYGKEALIASCQSAAVLRKRRRAGDEGNPQISHVPSTLGLVGDTGLRADALGAAVFRRKARADAWQTSSPRSRRDRLEPRDSLLSPFSFFPYLQVLVGEAVGGRGFGALVGGAGCLSSPFSRADKSKAASNRQLATSIVRNGGEFGRGPPAPQNRAHPQPSASAPFSSPHSPVRAAHKTPALRAPQRDVCPTGFTGRSRTAAVPRRSATAKRRAAWSRRAREGQRAIHPERAERRPRASPGKNTGGFDRAACVARRDSTGSLHFVNDPPGRLDRPAVLRS